MYILPETVTDAVLDNNMELTLTEMLDDKLSSAEDDTAHGKITLAGGAIADHLTSSTYTSGFGGKGYEIKMEGGESYLTVDNAYFRNKATFDVLEIREATHTGGEEIKSPASCTIADVGLYYPSVPFVDADGNEFFASDGQFMVVSSTANGYKCYFKASDGEKTIYNDWRVGDLALCHEFNLASGSRYYHRRVIAVSAEPEDGCHWVALSDADAQGTDTPIKGDKIVCFGSNITDRQNAIVLASNGDNAPYFAQLKGLDSFAISEENYITLLSPTKNIIKGNEIILMSESGDKNVGEEIESTKAALSVQSDRIDSVVTEMIAMIDTYSFGQFAENARVSNLPYDGGGLVARKEENGIYTLAINDVAEGDVVRVELNKDGAEASYEIIATDGDSETAYSIASTHFAAVLNEYEWLGQTLQLGIGDGKSMLEMVAKQSCSIYVVLIDGCGNQVSVSHIKAKISAQSRIDQTADNIRLQVGEAGINLDSKVITLDASKTIVTGDLAVSVVKTYWDAAQTQIKSAYNGNGEGTIVYYYPNGQIMKEDTFVTDSKGNVQGMRTTYYKADGSVAWTINEGGFMTTLPDYWTVLNNGNDLRYTTDEATMMEMLKQHLDDAMRFFSAAKFSRFVSQSGNYKNYNGKVSKAVRSSEAPTTSMLWSGVLVYSVELYEDGWNPTYIVTYEVCTTRLGQIGLIATKKFNSLGEIN